MLMIDILQNKSWLFFLMVPTYMELSGRSINTVCNLNVKAAVCLRIENIILEDSFERVFCDNIYADNELGTQLIQGHNIMLIGALVRT